CGGSGVGQCGGKKQNRPAAQSRRQDQRGNPVGLFQQSAIRCHLEGNQNDQSHAAVASDGVVAHDAQDVFTIPPGSKPVGGVGQAVVVQGAGHQRVEQNQQNRNHRGGQVIL